MSDGTANSEGTDGNGGEGTEGTGEGNQTPQVREPESVEDLPKWAQDKLTKANSEAAKYRTEKNNAVQKAKDDAKQENAQEISDATEARDNATVERDNSQLENLKLRAALNSGVPGESALEFADRLQGSTEDEISADAERLKSYFSTGKPDRPVDHSQGTGSGGNTPLNGDPMLNRVKQVVGIQ